MPLQPGTRLGSYEILALIGAGGMGEVYRARDSRLNRDVALKVLPAAFASDPDRMTRFQREAHVLASMNHPNIAAIYGLEESGTIRALVMELVDGPGLDARIADGPVPLDETIAIARQIAEALEYAHDRSIIHRDLKPANIRITREGTVKVLDFGLAKALDDDPFATPPEDSPTLTMAATRMGVILGTAAYMSPEQAKGKAVDRRADIWAFGVVLYEMLAGRQLYTGETAAETLASVMKDPVSMDCLPAGTPATIRNLLHRCLERDVRRRLQHIGEARIALENPSAEPAVPREAAVQRRPLAWMALSAILLIALVGLAFVHFREKAPEAMLESFSIPAPEKTSFVFNGAAAGPVTISPDGRRLVFSARSENGKTQLWVRLLSSLASAPLAGTEGGTLPFWSADGEHIGFFADGRLKKIDASGGPPLTLCDAPNGRGGTWNREGVIVFAPNSSGPLHRVSAAGGISSPVTALDSKKGETLHRWPSFLPDGRHFVYFAGIAGSTVGVIRAASIDSAGRDSTVIMPSPLSALYAQGHLLFLRDTTLMAQPFDVKRLATKADPVPVAEQVQVMPSLATAAVTASENGFLAYLRGVASDSTELAWFDRGGKQIGTLGTADNVTGIRFSPDRRSVAANILDPQTRNRDLWIYNVARELKTRFTFDTAEERELAWSPDGSTIVFNSNRKGHFDLYQKPSDGSASEELLYADDKDKYPTSFSPDGKLLLYMVYQDRTTKSHIWILPVQGTAGERKPRLFAQTAFNETWAQFSPDGRWIAYASDESQRNEIYVAPFPGPGGKRQISAAGGDQPMWRSDGKEIFFVAPDRKLMAAAVNTKGDVLEVGAVQPLFGPILYNAGHVYDVSADGQRFLVRTEAQQSNTEPLTLVQNWTALLRK